jgi:hypothetical protein
MGRQGEVSFSSCSCHVNSPASQMPFGSLSDMVPESKLPSSSCSVGGLAEGGRFVEDARALRNWIDKVRLFSNLLVPFFGPAVRHLSSLPLLGR